MARMQASVDRLVTIVAANDKLMKALITLLALRDPEILEELTIMFSADTGGDKAVSAHVKGELEKLSVLTEMTATIDDEPVPPARLS